MVQQRVDAVAGERLDAIHQALDPTKGILAQREVMNRSHVKPRAGQ